MGLRQGWPPACRLQARPWRPEGKGSRGRAPPPWAPKPVIRARTSVPQDDVPKAVDQTVAGFGQEIRRRRHSPVSDGQRAPIVDQTIEHLTPAVYFRPQKLCLGPWLLNLEA